MSSGKTKPPKKRNQRKAQTPTPAPQKVARWLEWLQPILTVCGISVPGIYAILGGIVAFASGATMHWMGVFPAVTLVWLALVFLALLASTQRRAVRTLLSIAAIMLLGVATRWLIREYIMERPRATTAELRQKYISNRTMYIQDIPLDHEKRMRVSNKTFDNCTIVGPALVAFGAGPGATTIDRCTFGAYERDPETIFYPLQPGRRAYVGGYAFDGVTMRDCTILNVGILMSRREFEEMAATSTYLTEDIPDDFL